MVKSLRVGVLSNPGATRLLQRMQEFEAAASRYDGIIHRQLSDILEIPEILKSFNADGIGLVVINGGDGTVQAVISSVINDQPFGKMPVFAILPGGRTNIIAADLGALMDPLHHLESLMDLVSDPSGADLETVSRPFIRLELTPGAKPIYGAFFGTATMVRGMEFCRHSIYPLGLPNFLAHSIAIFWVLLLALLPFKGKTSPMRKEPQIVRTVEGRIGPKAYFAFIVTGLDRILLGIEAGARGSDDNGLNSIKIEYSTTSILKAIPQILFGRPIRRTGSGIGYSKVSGMEIETDCPITLDGEFYYGEPGKPVRIDATEPIEFIRF